MIENDLIELLNLVVWVSFAIWAWRRGTQRGRLGLAWRTFQVVWPSLALIVMYYKGNSQRPGTYQDIVVN